MNMSENYSSLPTLPDSALFRCAKNGYTFRWYHLSCGEHFCNECFDHYYRRFVHWHLCGRGDVTGSGDDGHKAKTCWAYWVTESSNAYDDLKCDQKVSAVSTAYTDWTWVSRNRNECLGKYIHAEWSHVIYRKMNVTGDTHIDWIKADS